MKTVKKVAQIIAESFCIICPECGGSQPNQDGSEMWTTQDFINLKKTSTSAKRICVDCDAEFLLIPGNKALLQ